MNVAGVPYRTIRLHADGCSVEVIDQTVLPHEFRLVRLQGLQDAVRAIADMVVRGAPLIGATGAYSWKYKPAKKGAYRMQATIAATATNTAAVTKWCSFKVK